MFSVGCSWHARSIVEEAGRTQVLVEGRPAARRTRRQRRRAAARSAAHLGALLARCAGRARRPTHAPTTLRGGRRSLQGWPSGTSSDSDDTLAFSALADIRPMIETVPLERAADAYERMMSGAARFRMVITMGQ